MKISPIGNHSVLKPIDRLPDLLKKIQLATLVSRVEVTVGVLEDKNVRVSLSKSLMNYENGEWQGYVHEKITNAQLAGIHEVGAPASNIPARPFMRPAMADVAPKIYRILGEATRRHFKNRANAVEEGMVAAGVLIVEKMKEKIKENIPPPLSPEYASRRENPDPTPLINTGQLIRSLGYKLSKR